MTSIYSVHPAWDVDSGVDADSGLYREPPLTWDVDSGVDADSGLYREPPLTWAELHEDDDEGGEG